MIARYEQGSVSPTVSTLERILGALGQEVEIVIRESTCRPFQGPLDVGFTSIEGQSGAA